VIPNEARPRLASKARLRFDRHTQQHMLLYPERGMVLNATAQAIALLCTGQARVIDIVERLHAQSNGATREEVERDVQAFLDALLERGLIRVDP
jgi:coenzyme PQQ biosynthesis protein PqqD